MAKVFNRILSLLMAFMVLFSTISLTVDMHYCGGTLVDTAIFKKAKGCGMDMQTPLTEGCSITKKSCCNDEQIVIEGQDELKQSFEKQSFEKQQLVTLFVYSYLSVFENLDSKETSYQTYKPPLVVKEIYKIDETYLI